MATKKKVAPKESRPTISETDFNKYVDELYDHGLDSREVDQMLRSGLTGRRTNPDGRDFSNSFVWNTHDRLDRALGLAQQRMALVADYKKRLKQVAELLDMARLQMGMFGSQESAKTLLEVTKIFMETPVTPWADDSLTTDFLLCAVCRCDLCAARIKGESKSCCDHKDDTGSWGLPF